MFLVPFSSANRSASDFARSIERLFDDSFDRTGAYGGSEVAQRSPALDVAETESGYSVNLDLPGVAKENVKIAIDGRRVSVSAQTQREETKKDGERVIYRERSSASFARTFTLPEEIDQEASQAKLDNGVLSLTLAKKRASAAKQLTVN
ncbi:MAG: Hsp20/alpha crystallin family protein [Burkholderiaceae bacterium]|nr:Hsp20/alpha crystallin family protein [Burkholderiaceae bacterium]